MFMDFNSEADQEELQTQSQNVLTPYRISVFQYLQRYLNSIPKRNIEVLED